MAHTALCNGCYHRFPKHLMGDISLGEMPPDSKNRTYYYCDGKDGLGNYCEEVARARAVFAHDHAWQWWAVRRLERIN